MCHKYLTLTSINTFDNLLTGNCWARPARIRPTAHSPGDAAAPSSCVRPSPGRARSSSPMAMMKYSNLSSRRPPRPPATAPRPGSVSVHAMRIASPVSCLPRPLETPCCYLPVLAKLNFNPAVGLSFGTHTRPHAHHWLATQTHRHTHPPTHTHT